MAKRRVGAIDIGTNTVLLLVAEGPSGEPVAIAEQATITRLGQGVDRTRYLSAEGIERTLACLGAYADLLRRLDVDRTVAVCTSAARDARNGQEFLARAASVLGSRPSIIDGEAEAGLVFEGALTGLAVEGPVTVFDVGGGSTEIVLGTCSESATRVERAVSVDIGSVRLTERHIRHDPPEREELDAVRRDIDDHLSPVVIERSLPLVGVAGTMTTLAAIDQELSTYDPARVHGSSLSRSRMNELFDRLATMPLDRRRVVRGLDPARADVIVAGTLIALRLMERASADEVVVSDRGVRWGLAKTALSGVAK